MPPHKIVAYSRSQCAKEKIVKQLETQQCLGAYQMPTKVEKTAKESQKRGKNHLPSKSSFVTSI
jgi:hypothetical protein